MEEEAMTRTPGLMGMVLLAGMVGATLIQHMGRTTRPAERGGVAGAIVRTVPVGPQPINVQVDEQTGRAFVLNNGDDSVSVLDTRTGQIIDTAPLKRLGNGPVAAAMTVDARAGRVVIMNWDKSVSVLDARSGRLLYTVPSGGASDSVVVNTRTGRIFVSNWGDFMPSSQHPDVDVFKGGNTITVIDTRTGRHVGTIHVKGNPSAMAVDERTGRVFVKSDGGGFPGYTKLVSTLDGTSGRLVRTVVVGHDPRGQNPSQGAGNIVVDTRSGHVFVTSPYAESVSMLDATSGRLLRTVGGVHPGPAVVDERSGRVFVLNGGGHGTTGGTASVIDSRTGRVLGNVPVGKSTGLPVTPLVDAQTGRVFIANNASGTVSVLDARSGALLRTVPVGPHPAAMSVDVRSGRVFVSSLGAMTSAGYLTGPGSVSVLDARNGLLVRTIIVGVEPALIAVDERVGRAFVVNVAGNSHDALAPIRSLVPGLPPSVPPCNTYGRVSIRCHVPDGSVNVLDATR